MQKTRILRLEEIQPASDGSFEDLAYTPGTRHTPSAMVALAVHGPLTYSVSHELREQLNEIVSEQQPEALVLRLRTAHFIDYSSWNALFEFAEQFHRQGGRLYLTDLDAASRKAIQGAGAHLWLPEAQLFPPSEHQLESFHRALRSAAEQLSNPETLSGRWQDWLEHPHPLAQEKLREIDRFLRGDSS